MRTSVWALGLAAVALPATALGQSGRAAIQDVRYEVTFDSAAAADGVLRVAMSFRAAAAGPVPLSLPAWTPGAYEISDFARNVVGFGASSGDRALRWDKVDHDTWRVFADGAGPVNVRFDYVADSLDNAMAWSRPDFAFFNGTNVFLYPEGVGLEFPAEVVIHPGDGWRVATGLSGSAGRYSAPSYHDLVDMPVFVGRFDLDSTRIDGRWYRLATYPAGGLAGEGRRLLWSWIESVMAPMAAVFGETPWETYTTLIVFEQSFGGGSALEHQNSYLGIYHPQFIGNPMLGSITAHEIFHGWNVKRLRPVELVPYDYSRPQPTTLLWVSEGITDYYADLAFVRGGIIPPALFYRLTAGKIDAVTAAPPVALEDASLSTWIHPKDGTDYIYYPKGSLAGLLLDILIRDASNNRASLDDVLRDLYERTYKAGAGFTEAQWWDAVTRAGGGRTFEDFHRRYVDGRDAFPYERVLPLAGLALAADTARAPRLGVSTATDSLGVLVTDVAPGSAAAAAGIAAGDYLVRVGDIPAEDAGFGERFRERYGGAADGAPLAIDVRRDGQTITLAATLRFAREVSHGIREDARASSKAVRIRQGILEGRVER